MTRQENGFSNPLDSMPEYHHDANGLESPFSFISYRVSRTIRNNHQSHWTYQCEVEA